MARMRFREYFLGSFFLPDPYSLLEEHSSEEETLAREALQFFRKIQQFQKALESWYIGNPTPLQVFLKRTSASLVKISSSGAIQKRA